MRVLRSRTALPAIALSASLGAIFLTGCGAGTPALPDSVSNLNVTGKAYGGSTPITGATVTLYATGSSGYGSGSTTLATTTTNSAGGFSFSGASYSCPTGQQAYIVAAGGNTGAGTNNQSLLLAALGSCSNLSSSTSIWIDELSTVAAAYTLNNFLTISGTAPSYTVSIGAPANANSTSGACTNTNANVISSCTTASLTHAFANAANLVNSVGTTSAQPTGTAYTVTPSNSAGSVPQALLDTLGNALVSCVNTTTGSTGCSNLFTLATPPGGTAPTNTLQAMMNIARYPTNNAQAIYALSPATGAAYQPTLSTAPVDLSLAIVYTGLGTSGTAFTYPYYLTLDINDNVYSVNQTGSSTAATTGPTLTSLASNGAPGSTNSGVAAALCTAASACLMQADSLGNLWLANTNGTTNPNIYKFTTSSLALANTYSLSSSDKPNAVAINPLNTVYVTSASTTNANGNVFSLRTTDTTFGNLQYTATGATTTTPVSEAVLPEAVAVDSALDLININYASTATATTYLPNTVTSNVATTQPTFSSPTSSTQSTTVGSPYSVLIDGSDNEWVNNGKNLYAQGKGAAAPTLSAAITGTNGAGTTATASSTRYGTLDGVGDIFLPDNNTTSSYLWEYVPSSTTPTVTAGTFYPMNPCYAPAGATACQTTSTAGARPALYSPRNAQVDSTGSIWVASSTNGSIVQILGVGAPTWPLLGYAKPGVKPQ